MAEKMKETTERYVHELREVGGKLWDATQRTVSTAGSRAALYGKLVQRKLDLSSVDRRIEACHAKLGRVVSLAWEQKESDVFQREDVSALLAELEQHKAEREILVREMAALRAEPEATEAPPVEAEKERSEEELHL